MNNNPNVYLFNPTCEYAIANGTVSWQPNKMLQKMESDLSTLPLYFSRPGDYILVEKQPSEKYLESLDRIGISPPNFIKLKEAVSNKQFVNLPKSKLLPWGWSPVAHRLLAPLKENCSYEFKNSPVFEWKKEYREIYSKKFALEIQQILLNEFPSEVFISKDEETRICRTEEEFNEALATWGKLMAKAPWSSSGRGLQPITKTPIHPKVWEKLLGFVKEQGYAIVEAYQDKLVDLAFQFKLEKGKVSFLGLSNFAADKKGQYMGNSLNGLPEGLTPEVSAFASQMSHELVAPLISVIEKSKLSELYEGNFGVDTLIYTDRNGKIKINPCLEINVRQNMGLLSLYLEKRIVPEKHGIYRTWFQPGTSFSNFAKEMQKQHPLNTNAGKIEKGFFALTDVCSDSLFGAYLLV